MAECVFAKKRQVKALSGHLHSLDFRRVSVQRVRQQKEYEIVTRLWHEQVKRIEGASSTKQCE